LWLFRLDRQILSVDEVPPDNGTVRPVYAANDQLISRRNLILRFTSSTTSERVAALVPDETTASPGEKRLPSERQRLVAAAKLLPPPDSLALCPAPLEGQVFMHLGANETCTACGVCAQACPTGALRLEFEEQTARFLLSFAPTACIGCNVCLHLCDAGALKRRPLLPLGEYLQTGWIELADGTYQRCRKCGVRYAGLSANTALCPVCAFRRSHPFGHKVPPRWIADKL
jgi:ferredoxin